MGRVSGHWGTRMADTSPERDESMKIGADLSSEVSKRPRPAGWQSTAIYVMFLVSGAAALVYQLVWQRVLFRIYGIDIASVTIVVTAFMLGLGVGSLVGGVLSRLVPHAVLALFASFEMGIGAFGAVSLELFDRVGSRTAGAGHLATGVLAFLLVLVPTTLMGATLPLLVAWETTRTGNVGRSVSGLYFVNTLGAALGAFMAAGVLFRVLGLQSTVRGTAAINGALGLAVLALRGKGTRES